MVSSEFLSTSTVTYLKRLTGILFCLASPHLLAAPEAIAQIEEPDFQANILPIFKSHCLRCHNAETSTAGLDLSTRKGALKGSASGRVLVSGSPEESPLYEMVTKRLMPADAKTQLSQTEIEAIRDWIRSMPQKRAEASKTGEMPEVTQLDVIPLMLLHCTVCHGRRFQEGGLDLRTKAAMLKGGKSGPAMVLGKPDESLMVQRIRSGEMPPKEREMEASVRSMSPRGLARLTQWITQGAPEVEAEPDVRFNGTGSSLLPARTVISGHFVLRSQLMFLRYVRSATFLGSETRLIVSSFASWRRKGSLYRPKRID